MLAREVGASVPHLDEPQRVDMTELSRWLFSDMVAAKQVLSQLREENSVITHAFSPLRAGGNLEVRDFIGHRSGCQDFSLTLPWRDVVTEISGNNPILLYAGDNFRDSGNDRPIMEAIRESNEKAKIIAVTHRRDDTAAVPRWMIGTSQFQLFLIQYLAARSLKGNNLG
jgi:hypothetical protein